MEISFARHQFPPDIIRHAVVVSSLYPQLPKTAAMKRMRKLLKKHGFAPDVLVTDRLRSYTAAKSELR